MKHPPVDDATARYILETRKCFEDLRQVSAQIAGVLVLAAAGANSASPDHPMLLAAAQLHREALDSLRGARPTEAARPHQAWLGQAGEALGIALAASRRRMDASAVLPPLRAAYDSLQRASNALPGFPMVAFEQGCCAVHVSSAHIQQ